MSKLLLVWIHALTIFCAVCFTIQENKVPNSDSKTALARNLHKFYELQNSNLLSGNMNLLRARSTRKTHRKRHILKPYLHKNKLRLRQLLKARHFLDSLERQVRSIRQKHGNVIKKSRRGLWHANVRRDSNEGNTTKGESNTAVTSNPANPVVIFISEPPNTATSNGNSPANPPSVASAVIFIELLTPTPSIQSSNTTNISSVTTPINLNAINVAPNDSLPIDIGPVTNLPTNNVMPVTPNDSLLIDIGTVTNLPTISVMPVTPNDSLSMEIGPTVIPNNEGVITTSASTALNFTKLSIPTRSVMDIIKDIQTLTPPANSDNSSEPLGGNDLSASGSKSLVMNAVFKGTLTISKIKDGECSDPDLIKSLIAKPLNLDQPVIMNREVEVVQFPYQFQKSFAPQPIINSAKIPQNNLPKLPIHLDIKLDNKVDNKVNNNNMADFKIANKVPLVEEIFPQTTEFHAAQSQEPDEFLRLLKSLQTQISLESNSQLLVQNNDPSVPQVTELTQQSQNPQLGQPQIAEISQRNQDAQLAKIRNDEIFQFLSPDTQQYQDSLEFLPSLEQPPSDQSYVDKLHKRKLRRKRRATSHFHNFMIRQIEKRKIALVHRLLL